MPKKGYKQTKEHRKNLGLAHKNKKLPPRTDEWKTKQHNSKLGHNVSITTRKKISESHKKRYENPEARRRNAEIQKSEYKNNPEHRIKVGNKSRERGKDPNYRKKQREIKLKLYQDHPDAKLNHLEFLLGGFWYGNVRYPDPPKYCEKFNKEFKERVRAYWNYQCFECGELQNGRKLHVHHVHYDKKMCCNGSPQDTIPLCQSCHIKSNTNRDYWEDHFTELLYANDPNGKCFFTKEEFNLWQSL